MLRIRGLTQRYGERVALDGLSLRLAPGGFVALLGPNGAGKSTLFQVLTGLFAADAGEVEVAGFSMRTQARRALSHIGVVFQQQSLDLDLSIARNLQFHADLQGLLPATARARCGTCSGPPRRRPIRRCSTSCTTYWTSPRSTEPGRGSFTRYI